MRNALEATISLQKKLAEMINGIWFYIWILIAATSSLVWNQLAGPTSVVVSRAGECQEYHDFDNSKLLT